MPLPRPPPPVTDRLSPQVYAVRKPKAAPGFSLPILLHRNAAVCDRRLLVFDSSGDEWVVKSNHSVDDVGVCGTGGVEVAVTVAGRRGGKVFRFSTAADATAFCEAVSRAQHV